MFILEDFIPCTSVLVLLWLERNGLFLWSLLSQSDLIKLLPATNLKLNVRFSSKHFSHSILTLKHAMF